MNYIHMGGIIMECGVGDRKSRNQFTSIKFSLNPKKIVEHIEPVVVNLNQLSFSNPYQTPSLKSKKKKKSTEQVHLELNLVI